MIFYVIPTTGFVLFLPPSLTFPQGGRGLVDSAKGGKKCEFQHLVNENEQKAGLFTPAGSQKQSHYSHFPNIP